MSYEDLNILDELRRKGSITEEEFQREKDKVLNNQNNASSKQFFGGLTENTYLLLMHLSQFLGFIVPGFGFIVPLIMWLTNKDNSTNVDKHGKNIINFRISMFIYCVTAGVLFFISIVMYTWHLFGIPFGISILAILGILQFVFIIIAAIKANNGEYWKYPLAIKFLN